MKIQLGFIKLYLKMSEENVKILVNQRTNNILSFSYSHFYIFFNAWDKKTHTHFDIP